MSEKNTFKEYLKYRSIMVFIVASLKRIMYSAFAIAMTHHRFAGISTRDTAYQTNRERKTHRYVHIQN